MSGVRASGLFTAVPQGFQTSLMLWLKLAKGVSTQQNASRSHGRQSSTLIREPPAWSLRFLEVI